MRFGLADVCAALMRMSKEEFVEVRLDSGRVKRLSGGSTPLDGAFRHLFSAEKSDARSLKALLQKGECDRSLALYMASDVVELLGELGI